jgi:hypothetical protein
MYDNGGPAVLAEGLVKHFTGREGDVEAVRGVDLEVALVRADRLTATERAMASTVRGRPRPHQWRFQLSCSASPMMMPSGPRRKQSR